VTFRFISLSPTLKASFARHGERRREREREREMFFPITKIFKNNTERRRSIV
jgi:hypothetical protein